jgi:hypothetical protein
MNMDNVISVKVTSEDREHFDFDAPSGCPLAKALKRMFPKDTVIVFAERVRINAVSYSFNEKAYNETVVKKAKGDLVVILNKIMKPMPEKIV